MRLAAVELRVDLGDRILQIVAHVARRLVELLRARRSVREEAVLLARSALALDHQHERVGGKARRVRCAGRAMDDPALADHRDFLLALWRAVVEVHGALDHVLDPRARVYGDLAPPLAATGHEGDGVLRLPQHLVGPGAGADGSGDLLEVQREHGVRVHGEASVQTSVSSRRGLSTRMAWISASEKPRRRIIGTTLAKMWP